MAVPSVSIVTVTFNAARFLDGYCAALRRLAPAPLEVIVVDNASDDDSVVRLRRELPAATVVAAERNLGFAAGSNRGAGAARGDVLLFLNPDTEAPPDLIAALGTPVWDDPTIGAAGPKLVFPDGRIQCAGGLLTANAVSGHRGWGEVDRGQYDAAVDVPYVAGAALAIRRALFAEMGGFHEGYFPGFYEDTELCFRLRQRGLRVRYLPATRVVHLESPSMGRRGIYWLHRNRMLFLARNPTAGDGRTTEMRWLYDAHLRPLMRALLGAHPWKLRDGLRTLPPALAGAIAGRIRVACRGAQ